jgi:NADH-quinone oxidoreductase subunit L
MTRLMVMTFFGSERFHDEIEGEHGHDDHADDHSAHADDEDEHHHIPHDFKPHESPWTMWAPLVVLAILSTVGGLVGIPYAMSSLAGKGDVNVFEHILEPVIAKRVSSPHVSKGEAGHEATPKNEHASEPAAETSAAEHTEHNPEEISTERKLAGLSVVLAFTGIAIGVGLFRNKPLRKMPRILEDKWRIDELYNGYIVDPLTNLSREGLWKGFDLGFIDGIVNGIGHFVMEAGNAVRSLQVGFVRSYAAIILLGALAVLGYFIYYGWRLVG